MTNGDHGGAGTTATASPYDQHDQHGQHDRGSRPAPHPAAPPSDLPAGMALAALVVGVSAAAGAWVPGVARSLLLAVAAVVLGGIAYRRAPASESDVKGLALGGIVSGVAGLLLCLLGLYLTTVADVPDWPLEAVWPAG